METLCEYLDLAMKLKSEKDTFKKVQVEILFNLNKTRIH